MDQAQFEEGGGQGNDSSWLDMYLPPEIEAPGTYVQGSHVDEARRMPSYNESSFRTGHTVDDAS